MSVKNSIWSQQKQGFGKKKRKLLWVKCFFQSVTKIRLNLKSPLDLPLFKMYKVKFTWLWKRTWNFTNKYFTWKRLWLFKESWAKHSIELQNIYWDFKIFAKPSKLKVIIIIIINVYSVFLQESLKRVVCVFYYIYGKGLSQKTIVLSTVVVRCLRLILTSS